MDLERKTEIAKQAMNSLIDHDDVEMYRVKAAFEAVAAHAAARMAAAALRRKAKEAAE